MNQLDSKYKENSFKKKMEKFLHNIPNYSYIFEVTKMCGFSEFFTIYKDNTLSDLHANLALQLKSNCIKRLYMIHSITLEQITVPVDKNITVRKFIVDNNCFKPFYESPTPTVYKIYLEYGRSNDEDTDEFNEFG
jgi:hypothetical protein